MRRIMQIGLAAQMEGEYEQERGELGCIKRKAKDGRI